MPEFHEVAYCLCVVLSDPVMHKFQSKLRVCVYN
jgi:hypothetical protein